jgi:excisionase family DNA binding protein
MFAQEAGELLTPSQVAEEVHVTVATVRRWINSGALRASKAGPRRWMLRRSDLDAFLAGSARVEPAVEPSEDPSFRRHLVVPQP